MDTWGSKNGNSINYLVQCSKVFNIARPTSIGFSGNSLPIYFIEDRPDCAAVLLAALAKPGVLILKSGNLTNLWEGAVERKLIHKTRHQVEQRLGTTLDHTGLITSLVANQKTIIVHNEKIKNEVDSVLSAINSGAKVLLLPSPTSELVYDELDQDFSILNYKVNVNKKASMVTFKEYAKLLFTEVEL
jgi:hypothetical protein